jgi:hypothetical protein
MVFLRIIFEGAWKLVIVDIDSRSILYLSCDESYESTSTKLFLTSLSSKLQTILRSITSLNIISQWQCKPHPKLSLACKLRNSEDSGVYIITVIYYIIHGIPICFQNEDLTTFRAKFSEWLLAGKIPFHYGS